MAVVLREAGVPERPPAAAHRDRAAHLLVQRAVRRMPGVLGSRHPHVRGRRPDARRRGALHPRGRRSSPGPLRARASSSTTSACWRVWPTTSTSRSTPRGRTCSVDVQDAMLRGENYKVTVKWKNRYGREMRYSSGFEGVVPYIERQYAQAESDTQRSALGRVPPRGAVPRVRRQPSQARGPRRAGARSLDRGGASRLSLADAQLVLRRPSLSPTARRKIAAQVLREIRLRLDFLLQVGLSYLNLSRSAGSLSGGEAQRIRLATQIGSGLTGRALRARRAVDRSAPARQPSAHRDAAEAARPRQHAHRRRARRGDHPRRLTGSSTSGRARESNGGEVVHSGPYEAAPERAATRSRDSTSPVVARSRPLRKRRKLDKKRMLSGRRCSREQPEERQRRTSRWVF